MDNENENNIDDLDGMIDDIEKMLPKEEKASATKSSPEEEKRIKEEIEKIREARKEKKCETMESKKTSEVRKDLKYKKYILPRIFLAIQTGFTSELAFWLGRKSTEDGIRAHIEDADK